MFKILNNLIPSTFSFPCNDTLHNYNTRNKNDLHIQFCRTKGRQMTLKFQGPRLWNELPSNIKSAPTLAKFKKCIKSHSVNN